MRRIIFLPLIVMIVSGCAARQMTVKEDLYPEQRFTISNVSAKPKTINNTKSQRVKIEYSLSQDAEVSVDIYDSDDRWINSIKKDVTEKAGKNLVKWDGKDSNEELVPSGAYIYVIKAKDNAGKKTKYDPADISKGIGLSERELIYNKEKNKVRYILPRAARVLIRAGIKEGPLLKTLADWEPREAGKNSEGWDGQDNAGNLITQHPDFTLFLSAYSLPDNSIIVKNNNKGFEYECAFELKTEQPRRVPRNVTGIILHPSAKQSCRKTRVPRFSIEFPEADHDEKSVPVIAGPTTIRLSCDEQDKHLLVESRFEIICYIDNIFYFEEEQGFTPFNYRWDPQGMTAGEHIVTFNLQSYTGAVGTKSLKVRIKGRKQ
ncbi:MAG: FlgD immunoglobulin-like domain containing protein [Candidatus Omnitrophota bacterium]